jgi:hypothetical protein
MKIKIGDKVKFLNDVGGGKVIKIIDKNSVLVLTEDDFELPAFIHELLVIDETSERKSNKNDAEKEEVVELSFEKRSDEVAVYLGFIHNQQKSKENSNLDYYLINDSNFYFDFVVLFPDQQFWQVSFKGSIEPNTKLKVGSLAPNKFSEFTKMHIQGFFHRSFRYELKPLVNLELSFNPIRFVKSGSFLDNEFFEEDALIFAVIEENKLEKSLDIMSNEELKNLIKEKEKQERQIPKSQEIKWKQKELEKRIVDLHIGELIENYAGLEAKDMLDVQINAFRSELEEAIEQGVKRIVFIHGVGNGKLKTNIRRELEKQYKKYEFQDASFAEYGYGATLVILRK